MKIVPTIVVLVFALATIVSSDLTDQKEIHLKSSSGQDVNIKWKKRDLRVYNGVSPAAAQNGVPATKEQGKDVNGVTPDKTESGGLNVHSGKVLSQVNVAMRKRREIIQNIHEVHKQVNVSKRNVAEGSGGNGTNTKTKRHANHVDTINKQTNIDMGN